MRNLLGIGIWYLIFAFLTATFNSMEWGTFSKVMFVIIAIISWQD